jgi:UDP-glucose 4-epimerase
MLTTAISIRTTDLPLDTAKILVTGAHGFIGRHAARCFARHGHIVIGMGHGRWMPDEWRSWGLSEWYESDISIPALCTHAGRPNVIVHCAGSGSVALSLTEPLEDFHRTVTTTASVLDYVRAISPSTRVVYPSSASVYGAAKTIPITEDTACAPISPYGSHKWMAEQLIVSYCRHYAVSASIVRFFSVYGCGLRKQLLWDGCQKLASGDRVFMGTGNEVRDWLHVDDAAELLRVSVRHASPACPIANGGTGEGVSVRELLTQLALSLRAEGGQIVFSESPRAGDPNIYIAETERAEKWGWMPVANWRERVAEYVAWWQLEMGLSRATPSPPNDRA